MTAVRERYFIDHKSIDAKTNKTRISYRSLKMGINERKELPFLKTHEGKRGQG